MDLDLFVARHEAEWRRLDALGARRRLTGAEADELVALYRQVATHLALVQSRAPDPVVAARLSRLLARGRAAAVGTPPVRGWAALARGVTVDFPTIVYRTWRWSVATAAVNIAVSVAMWLYLRAHPDRIDRVLPGNEVHRLVRRQFRHYYSAAPAQSFAAHVWTNNALVAALALFLGVTLVGTISVLVANTANLGLVGGIMIASGHSGEFFGLILPHGMLELTAVFTASAIGLRTGWAWVAPGRLTRAESLAAAGREAGVCALGLAGVLLVSGLIEAFVTPSGLPTWARIGIGAVAELGFLTYVIVLGRRGVRAGLTGDLAEGERGAALPVA
ncbi:stage II sporulation protein M [Jatrophihabitans endophyticus]|uniref:stage II sporulation protein M n=1 Tax=Jatrophihabitans endophyticus TaxID=1206085 RepID=UPI0019F05CEE|nr:stage II sporulation protein M [Jatrophihabitans endophyticus]MBE7188198.1 stage II sporulation protein M [Jatrophihabitans endophyticus]